MNTQHATGGLLLASLLATGLAAQELQHDVLPSRGKVEFRIDGARKHDLALVVVGLELGAPQLPNGRLLGVDPALLTGFVVADRDEAIWIKLAVPEVVSSFAFYSQAVTVSPRLPLEDRAAFLLSDVVETMMPATAIGG
ncbi:MAG: hypothetical protein KF830_16850 [Planctomycetes bacterium]|nr:hypothetical protein [Planctomycetota bacterium]